MRKLDYNQVYHTIYDRTKNYLLNNNIKNVIIGISGGFDSGFNCILMNRIAKEIDLKISGVFIAIESNSKVEEERADLIGRCFTSLYWKEDFTDLFNAQVKTFDRKNDGSNLETKANIIRKGNIKANLRSSFLYSEAAKCHGIVINNSNLSEWLLGFWTISCSDGDLAPISNLYKTEAYELAKFMADTTEDKWEKEALEVLINAVPTDGLGISKSDVEQFGVDSYAEVDNILRELSLGMDDTDYISELYGLEKEKVEKIKQRVQSTNFKRNHPITISID